MPGCVRPSSGPITCTMPCLPLAGPKKRMPYSAQLRSRCWNISSASGSASGRFCESVGMMWSTVAKVRCGNGTVSFGSRSAANACGLVTSWIRWSPMKSWVCPLGSSRTVCASQTLSRRVFDVAMARGIALASRTQLGWRHHEAAPHRARPRGRRARSRRSSRCTAGARTRSICSGSRRSCTAARRWCCVRRDRYALADPQSRMVIGYGWFPIPAGGRPPDPLEFAKAVGLPRRVDRRSARSSIRSTATTSCCSASARAA